MKKVIAGILFASLLRAASFEAASIRPSESADSHNSSVRTSNGLVRMYNVSLRRIIIFAYGIPEAQISGIPKSLEDQRYEVIARSSNPKDDDPELMPMMQALLAERFGLVLHHESRIVSGYALTIAKGGIKATPSAEDAPASTNSSRNRISAKGCPLSRLVLKLSDYLSLPVVDLTEEKRSFDFDLQWVPDEVQSKPDAPAGPTLFTALQEQLGVKLESRKVPVDFLVIDHAEAPSDN